jgi:hypothetical protein
VILASGNLTDACQALIDTAKSQGAVDNVTCLLVQFFEPVNGHVAAEPAAEIALEAVESPVPGLLLE